MLVTELGLDPTGIVGADIIYLFRVFLQGSALGDCCCNYWCAFCTLAQESQELQGVGGQSMARE